MAFMTPPMFDPSNIVVWKIRMTVYLQTLGHKVYLAITKESFLSDSKHIGANAQALEAIRNTLSKDYLLRASNIDSAFAVWNLLTTTTTSELINRRSLVENPTHNAIWSKGMTPLRYIRNPT